MRRIGVEERRARLGLRHHLANEARGRDVVEVVGDLVALHSTIASSVYLAAWARMPSTNVGDVERALYDDKFIEEAGFR